LTKHQGTNGSGHQEEYDDNMVIMLELIWGKGYMAPGGPGNVANLLEELETRGKRILDIGCGIGGPAFEMARTHGASVVGIDLEAPLIERAVQAAADLDLDEQCTFQTVTVGALPFADESFDIVISSGAFTQTEDKAGILAETRRVLKPGGTLSCYDWLKSGADYSEDMLYWFNVEGLTYALETLFGYHRRFLSAGYVDVVAEDASAWYRDEVQREYQLIQGELFPRMLELLGQEAADHFVENWRALAIVIDKGEMRQGYCRGRRPF
jgi:ubiquinone/menaquinone biosynthesis C-methylase UbiE